MDDLQRLGFVDFHMEYYNWGLEYPFSPETEKLFNEYRVKYRLYL